MLAYPRVLGKNPPKFCRRQNAARQSVSSIAFQQVLRKGSGKPSPKEGFPESLVSPVSLHKGILGGRIISSPTNHLFKFFEGRGELSSKKVPHIFRISRIVARSAGVGDLYILRGIEARLGGLAVEAEQLRDGDELIALCDEPVRRAEEYIDR
mgnify:CR=1 FL=1